MNQLIRWQRRCLAITIAAVLLSVGGVANAQNHRATVTPPAGFTGYDLTITSLRSHGGCKEGTVGQFRQDSYQTIHQNLPWIVSGSTLARVTVWNWDWNPRRVQLRGTGNNVNFKVMYFVGDQNITPGVVAGTYRTPLLNRGASFNINVRASMRSYGQGTQSEPFDVHALGVRFTNSVIHGDRVRTIVTSVPDNTVPPCN